MRDSRETRETGARKPGTDCSRFPHTADGSNGQFGNMSCLLNGHGTTVGPCPQNTFHAANNQIIGYSYGRKGVRYLLFLIGWGQVLEKKRGQVPFISDRMGSWAG